MTLLSRLRAWLRPYPDAAEMQAAMLAEIPRIQQFRKEMRRVEAGVREMQRQIRESCVDLGFFNSLGSKS
jgi:hypothetical protein